MLKFNWVLLPYFIVPPGVFMENQNKKKSITIIAIAFVLCLIFGYYFIYPILTQSKESRLVKGYLKDRYKERFANITLLNIEDREDPVSCDGSTFFTNKKRNYYFSAYSKKNDLTFYIKYNKLLGISSFEDTYKEFLATKNCANEIKQTIASCIDSQNNNLNLNMIYPPHDKSFSCYTVEINIDIDKNYEEVINRDLNSPVVSILDNFYYKEDNYNTIHVTLISKNGKEIKLGYNIR